MPITGKESAHEPSPSINTKRHIYKEPKKKKKRKIQNQRIAFTA
jgi:hypothetical protein